MEFFVTPWLAWIASRGAPNVGLDAGHGVVGSLTVCQPAADAQAYWFYNATNTGDTPR
jgi:hypothetical protein